MCSFYLQILIRSLNADALCHFQGASSNASMHRCTAHEQRLISKLHHEALFQDVFLSPRTSSTLLRVGTKRPSTTSPCPYHHRYGGQESSLRLKFCNGPGRPSQDEQTRNLHCNLHPWLFHHYNQNLHNWKHHRPQIIVESLAC